MSDVVTAAPVSETLPIESSTKVPEPSRTYLLVHEGAVSRVFFLPQTAEVTVGLGLIVAIYRRRLPVDVDELSELHG